MPAAISEQKAELRRAVRALPEENFEPLLQAFCSLPEVKDAGTLLLFAGVGREPDTSRLIDDLLAEGRYVALPRCLPGHQMEACLIRSRAELVSGAYGIPEPDSTCTAIDRDRLDVILVPNLCCDREGYRLGHGGGYYDRYLAGYNGFTVAICPERWIQQKIPRDRYDIPVRRVLSEV